MKYKCKETNTDNFFFRAIMDRQSGKHIESISSSPQTHLQFEVFQSSKPAREFQGAVLAEADGIGSK